MIRNDSLTQEVRKDLESAQSTWNSRVLQLYMPRHLLYDPEHIDTPKETSVDPSYLQGSVSSSHPKRHEHHEASLTNVSRGTSYPTFSLWNSVKLLFVEEYYYQGSLMAQC